MNGERRSIGSLIAKSIISGWAYAAGVVIAGIITAALHFPQPSFSPEIGTPGWLLLRMLLSSTLMGFFLAPLALGVEGTRAARGLALAALIFVCLGLNTVLEMRIFSTMLVHGGAEAILIGAATGALLCGAAFALLFGSASLSEGTSRGFGKFFRARSWAAWSWRFVAAELAFPVAYFVFGMVVAPFVVEVYRHGNLGLVLPPMGAIVRTVLVRSVFFLAASFPFLVLWKRSRLKLILALGLAHWMLVGLFGLLQVAWFPAVLRVAHSLEIGADSFAYAAALVFLLRPRH